MPFSLPWPGSTWCYGGVPGIFVSSIFYRQTVLMERLWAHGYHMSWERLVWWQCNFSIRSGSTTSSGMESTMLERGWIMLNISDSYLKNTPESRLVCFRCWTFYFALCVLCTFSFSSFVFLEVIELCNVASKRYFLVYNVSTVLDCCITVWTETGLS